MGKKNKRRKKIKHERYKDHNLSILDDHQRQGKKLTPPMMRTRNQVLSSWLDDALPDMLWAVILTAHLKRQDYLDLFRKVVRAGKEGLKDYEGSFISHSGFSILSDADFKVVAAPLIGRTDVKDLLSALLLFDGLPDRLHWEPHLAVPDPDKHWEIIASAVFGAFDHQSEKATDCRWLKVLYAMVTGKITVPEEKAQEWLNYPNQGDMRSVRPSIRALEMTFRFPDFLQHIPDGWNEVFWIEGWEKTQCISIETTKPNIDVSRIGTKPFAEAYAKVVEHCHLTLKSSGIDPRHDGAFGLVLYGLYLAMEISKDTKAFRGEARITLRSLVEACLTLKYLSHKDDSSIWKQYRNYGAGQSKLSFLKHITADSVPDYVNIEDLERHASADMWMEFQEIDLGAWSNKNLRRMAEGAGVKEVYDRYYDWPSGFVHANWSAVRDTVFEMCGNPLHRLHRVASFPRLNMNDTVVDAGKLVNLMLDELNKLYPTFKPRIRTKEDN